jgi:hypothetical protein
MIHLTVLCVLWCAEGTVISVPIEDQVPFYFVWDYIKCTPFFYCGINNMCLGQTLMLFIVICISTTMTATINGSRIFWYCFHMSGMVCLKHLQVLWHLTPSYPLSVLSELFFIVWVASRHTGMYYYICYFIFWLDNSNYYMTYSWLVPD